MPQQVYSCEYCRIFKITYFEEHLQTASISCSKRSVIRNLAFAQPILLKFLFQNEDKITMKSRGFTKNLKAKVCAFYTGPVTNVKSS